MVYYVCIDVVDDVACALVCHHMATYMRATWRTRGEYN